MTALFDDIPRTSLGPARHNERNFEYLNLSARSEARQVRNLLEDWFSRYPLAHQNALASRIRSRSDSAFDSAAFELALHELLLVIGCSVIEIEPVLANGRAPDFLVEDREGNRIYIEAVSEADMSDIERAAEARINEAVQAIDEAKSPSFHLNLTVEGSPSSSVPQREMRASLQFWIDNLATSVEPWVYEFGGATFTVTVMMPRRNSATDSRAISSRSFGGGASAPHLPIREALKSKAKRYGVLKHPFVIAINSNVMGQDESDLVAALFGSEIVQVPLSPEGPGEPILARARDGLWFDHRGARRKAVSAVMYFDRFGPWTANLRSPLLILNPWADKPVHPLDRINRIEVVDEQLQNFAGQSLSELFNLEDGWLQAE